MITFLRFGEGVLNLLFGACQARLIETASNFDFIFISEIHRTLC
jgi:hypothetical protein